MDKNLRNNKPDYLQKQNETKTKTGEIMTKEISKRQLTLLVDSDYYNLLKQISELDDKTVSQLVRELFETLKPGLIQARDMMLAARDLNDAARKTMLPEIERHGKQLELNVKYGVENIEKILKDPK